MLTLVQTIQLGHPCPSPTLSTYYGSYATLLSTTWTVARIELIKGKGPTDGTHPWKAHDHIACSEAQESTSLCFLTCPIHDTTRYRERINQYDANLVNEWGCMSSSGQAGAWQHTKSTRCRFLAVVPKGNTKRHGSCLQNQVLGDVQCSWNIQYTDRQSV